MNVEQRWAWSSSSKLASINQTLQSVQILDTAPTLIPILKSGFQTLTDQVILHSAAIFHHLLSWNNIDWRPYMIHTPSNFQLSQHIYYEAMWHGMHTNVTRHSSALFSCISSWSVLVWRTPWTYGSHCVTHQPYVCPSSNKQMLKTEFPMSNRSQHAIKWLELVAQSSILCLIITKMTDNDNHIWWTVR